MSFHIYIYWLLRSDNLRKYVLTEKIWEYLIRLVYDVITLGTAVAFLQASSNTFIAGFKSIKKKKNTYFGNISSLLMSWLKGK